jgi:hypothetical protein
MKHCRSSFGSGSSTDQGGGKRRLYVLGDGVPLAIGGLRQSEVPGIYARTVAFIGAQNAPAASAESARGNQSVVGLPARRPGQPGRDTPDAGSLQAQGWKCGDD